MPSIRHSCLILQTLIKAAQYAARRITANRAKAAEAIAKRTSQTAARIPAAAEAALPLAGYTPPHRRVSFLGWVKAG